MNKSTKIVSISIAALFLVTAGLWLINGGGVADEDTGAVILFKEDGVVITEADLEYVKSLNSFTFETVIRSSGQKPAGAEYTGVFLKDLLAGTGIPLDGKKQVTVKGADGYAWTIALSELEEKDVYIVFEMNGKPLKSKIQNGDGPFQLVIPGDRFSQRWCKYVCEVDVK